MSFTLQAVRMSNFWPYKYQQQFISPEFRPRNILSFSLKAWCKKYDAQQKHVFNLNLDFILRLGLWAKNNYE